MRSYSIPLTFSRMTFWSRYDPIRHVQGNTDHWAKYRQQVRPPTKLTQDRICFFLSNIFDESQVLLKKYRQGPQLMSMICYKWVLALNVPVVHVYRISTSMNYINAGIVIEPHCSIVLVTEVWSFMNVCCKSIRFNHKCSMYMYL